MSDQNLPNPTPESSESDQPETALAGLITPGESQPGHTEQPAQTSQLTPSVNAKAGDLIMLIDAKSKYFLFTLESGEKLHTHRGILPHDSLIGLPYGSLVRSHMGDGFFLMKPTLADLLYRTKRNSQILYPKDIGFILVNMGIGPGMRVLEAGTGSGAMTTALAYAVGAVGQVLSYDIREDMQNLARKNLRTAGLESRVQFKLRDIAEGFDETGVDALFLDVLNPEDFMRQVRQALRPGGPFGCLVPTTNQVSRLVEAMQRHNFAFIEVCEIMLRYYKPVPERLRPEDRMIAHTGFLVFGRPMLDNAPLSAALPENNPADPEPEYSDAETPGAPEAE